MRATRLSLRLLLPLGLILLVVLLGALQYRWLGQVSEAERAQLQRTLAVRANEFAAEFDREIAVAYSALAIDGTALETDPWAAIAAQHDAWKARAMLPSMVRSIYLARSADGASCAAVTDVTPTHASAMSVRRNACAVMGVLLSATRR